MKTIHLLNWKLSSIKNELPNIKRQGFDSIQINPMQPFKEEKVFHWYLSYQPLGFRIGNMFGSKEDLIDLCNEAKKYNIDIIVDVVLNHMANKGENNELIPHPSVDRELLDNKSFWKRQCQMSDGDNRWDATNNLIGLPGLDLSNKDLQVIIFRFLLELKKCGVKGIRFDAAKHIGLYNDGVDFFNKVRWFLLKNNMYGYGEFIGGDKEWRDEMAKQILVLAPYSSTLSNLKRLITFYESHDTFLNDFDDTTRYLTKDDLIIIYRKLRHLFDKTLCYERPLLYSCNPYFYNLKNMSFDEVYKLNERDYFDTLYLDSPEIREINSNVKTLRRK